ncbi:MAG: hypothetical protein WC777_00110 [Candidatus Gracilibacteria bacterium]|jgi:hypothetical protein
MSRHFSSLALGAALFLKPSYVTPRPAPVSDFEEEKEQIARKAMDAACAEESLECEENKARILQEAVLESLARKLNTLAPAIVALQRGAPSQKPKLFITRMGSKTTFILEFEDIGSENWNEDFAYNLVLHTQTDLGEGKLIVGNSENELVARLAQALTPRY